MEVLAISAAGCVLLLFVLYTIIVTYSYSCSTEFLITFVCVSIITLAGWFYIMGSLVVVDKRIQQLEKYNIHRAEITKIKYDNTPVGAIVEVKGRDGVYHQYVCPEGSGVNGVQIYMVYTKSDLEYIRNNKSLPGEPPQWTRPIN